jgi:hypothetical protein
LLQEKIKNPDYLREQRTIRQKIILQRLQRGVAEGDLSPDFFKGNRFILFKGDELISHSSARRRDAKRSQDHGQLRNGRMGFHLEAATFEKVRRVLPSFEHL